MCSLSKRKKGAYPEAIQQAYNKLNCLQRYSIILKFDLCGSIITVVFVWLYVAMKYSFHFSGMLMVNVTWYSVIMSASLCCVLLAGNKPQVPSVFKERCLPRDVNPGKVESQAPPQSLSAVTLSSRPVLTISPVIKLSRRDFLVSGHRTVVIIYGTSLC